MIQNNMKKAQGLPLNTIVIALLVVVVLVVIILAFTTNIAGFNESVNEQGASQCDLGNPAIQTMGYESVSTKTISSGSSREEIKCDSGEEIRILRDIEQDDSADPATYSGTICCGTK